MLKLSTAFKIMITLICNNFLREYFVNCNLSEILKFKLLEWESHKLSLYYLVINFQLINSLIKFAKNKYVKKFSIMFKFQCYKFVFLN